MTKNKPQQPKGIWDQIIRYSSEEAAPSITRLPSLETLTFWASPTAMQAELFTLGKEITEAEQRISTRLFSPDEEVDEEIYGALEAQAS